jgi:hypothetical protein
MTAQLFDELIKDPVGYVKEAFEGPGVIVSRAVYSDYGAGDLRKSPTVGGVHIPSSNTGLIRRKLVRHDDKTAKTPFQYHGSALAQIRPDQMPRVLAAVTNPEELETRELPFNALTAIQNRVDPNKVAEIAGSNRFKGPAVVVRLGAGRHLIWDGHHRLTAEWMLGRDSAQVRYKDVGKLSNAVKRDQGAGSWSAPFDVVKLDAEAKQVFGWASVVERNGELVIDKQNDIIEPAELEAAAYDFVLNSRSQGDMHDRANVGRMIESMVFTREKQDVLGIDLGKVGWFVGFQVDDSELWEAHKSGRRPEFSIGGRGVREDIDE